MRKRVRRLLIKKSTIKIDEAVVKEEKKAEKLEAEVEGAEIKIGVKKEEVRIKIGK